VSINPGPHKTGTPRRPPVELAPPLHPSDFQTIKRLRLFKSPDPTLIRSIFATMFATRFVLAVLSLFSLLCFAFASPVAIEASEAESSIEKRATHGGRVCHFPLCLCSSLMTS
jgi:hypothetical protein